MDYNTMDLSVLIGQTASHIQVGHDEVCLFMQDGSVYSFLHIKDCCESVTVEDVIGDIQDIIDSPILMAEEVISNKNPADVNKVSQDSSFKWTFYKLATVKGYVTIRWYGESNGYYSESVDLVKLK